MGEKREEGVSTLFVQHSLVPTLYKADAPMASRGEARKRLASAMILFSLFSWSHQISPEGAFKLCEMQQFAFAKVAQIPAHVLVRAPCRRRGHVASGCSRHSSHSSGRLSVPPTIDKEVAGPRIGLFGPPSSHLLPFS
jgi:hypothetical protein